MNLKKPFSYTQMVDFLLSKEKEASTLYEKMTARQLAEHYQIFYNKNWQKACFRILGDKGQGLGGSRFGAGNFRKNENDIYGRWVRNRPKKQPFAFSFSQSTAKIISEKAVGMTYTAFVERAIQFYADSLILTEKNN